MSACKCIGGCMNVVVFFLRDAGVVQLEICKIRCCMAGDAVADFPVTRWERRKR